MFDALCRRCFKPIRVLSGQALVCESWPTCEDKTQEELKRDALSVVAEAEAFLKAVR